MSIIDFLIDDNKWKEFLEYKNTKFITKKEYDNLKDYINNKSYYDTSYSIVNNNYTFSIPNKKYINKNSSSKKRIIYTFNENENYILKMLHFLLYNYDYLLCDNCYSFRKNINSKNAFIYIKNNSKDKYGYKLDIKNYFNSIPNDNLLNILNNKLDYKDYQFFYNILSNKYVNYKDKVLKENKGAMAGTPISCFLSNIYLSDLDFYFKDSIYARYADDIILFDSDLESLKLKVNYITNYLDSIGLKLNEEKVSLIKPNTSFSYLGFQYDNGIITISNHTKLKLKKKLKRKARALRRWARRKNISYDKAAISFIKIFKYKFFYEKRNKELNWSLWYFPIINTDKDLKEIDNYFQNCIRFIITGHYKKSNYIKVPYSKIKELGYISLVNKYYEYKNEG